MVTEFIPTTVREWVDRLHDATGVQPVVTVPMARRWSLVLTNERVRLTMEFNMSRGSRCVRGGSTLWIDGMQVEVADSFEHFVRVFANPDQEHSVKRVPPPGWEAGLVEHPIAEAPELVRDTAQAMTRKIPAGAATSIVVGTVTATFWALEIRMVRGVLRMMFHLWPDGTCQQVQKPAFLLMVDDVDLTDEANGKLDKALAMMNRPAHDSAPAGAAVSHTAATTRDVGVETRKNTVLRL